MLALGRSVAGNRMAAHARLDSDAVPEEAKMAFNGNSLKVRQATLEDGPLLCELLNEIILIGGTTALETPMTSAELTAHYINGPDCLTCFVAQENDSCPIGFQMLVKNAELPADWADIGTFTKRRSRNSGVGTALFERTRRKAFGFGLVAINATIRADNHGGLSYYNRMGFKTYKIVGGVPLKDGTPIDRIYKEYFLSRASSPDGH